MPVDLADIIADLIGEKMDQDLLDLSVLNEEIQGYTMAKKDWWGWDEKASKSMAAKADAVAAEPIPVKSGGIVVDSHASTKDAKKIAELMAKLKIASDAAGENLTEFTLKLKEGSKKVKDWHGYPIPLENMPPSTVLGLDLDEDLPFGLDVQITTPTLAQQVVGSMHEHVVKTGHPVLTVNGPLEEIVKRFGPGAIIRHGKSPQYKVKSPQYKVMSCKNFNIELSGAENILYAQGEFTLQPIVSKFDHPHVLHDELTKLQEDQKMMMNSNEMVIPIPKLEPPHVFNNEYKANPTFWGWPVGLPKKKFLRSTGYICISCGQGIETGTTTIHSGKTFGDMYHPACYLQLRARDARKDGKPARARRFEEGARKAAKRTMREILWKRKSSPECKPDPNKLTAPFLPGDHAFPCNCMSAPWNGKA
jgi:hypothetical protein